MIGNFIKIAIRSLLNEKRYSLINIMGLTIGLAVTLLILLWVKDEIGTDKFHTDLDKIHRVLCNIDSGNGDIETWTGSPYPLSHYLQDNYPEVEKSCAYDPTNKKTFRVKEKELLADGIYATRNLFHVLSFNSKEGNIETFFSEPNVVAVSENLAKKLYGDQFTDSIIGREVEINGEIHKIDLVFENIPKSSSLDFEFVLDLDHEHAKGDHQQPWGTFDVRTLIKLKQGVDLASFKSKVENVVRNQNDFDNGVKIFLQPYGEQYLYGNFENGKVADGRISYVRLFSLAAIFLLVIACINFVNLATARALRRSKEVGVRKSIGAPKRMLITQFMIEAAVVSGMSLLLALLVTQLSLPQFYEITGKELLIDFKSPGLWILLGAIGLFTVFLAGFYPALFLSSLKTTEVLKGNLSSGLSATFLRKSLVVFQFVLSTILVVCALVVHGQIDFLNNKQLGLDKDNILYFRTPPGAENNIAAFNYELSNLQGVVDITSASTNPLSVGGQTGDPMWEGMSQGQELLFNLITADHNFCSTMRIPIAYGRDFSPLLSSDSTNFLVNETAVQAMQLEDPVGKRMEFWGVSGYIVGVVKDFHIQSLHEAIEPLIIGRNSDNNGLTMMRIDPRYTESVISNTSDIFGKFAEGFPFRYDFLNERYEQMYRSEKRTGTLSGWFAFIALLISSLGLLGLSTFIAEQKTKEIGIRKILGANAANLVTLLTKGFLKLIVFSLVIALPLGYYLSKKWLDNYEFSIKLDWTLFAISAALVLLLALITVAIQGVRAASVDPIKAIKSE